MDSNFTYEIVKPIAVLGTYNNGKYTVELNLISFNGKPPKYDIRKWDRENNKMMKGITLNDEDLKNLKAVLSEMEIGK